MEDIRDRQKELKRRYLEFSSILKANSPLAGEWESVFKGEGFELADIREFQPGDEIKKIHWPKTVQTNRLHIIERSPSRQIETTLVLDVSSSMQVSGKFSIASSVAGILAASATHFDNSVGLLAFSENLEKEISSAFGENHVFEMLEYLALKEKNPVFGKKTDFSKALEKLANLDYSRRLIFLISDFLTVNLSVLEKFLKSFSGKCDCVPLIIRPPDEYNGLSGFRANLSDSENDGDKEFYFSKDLIARISERQKEEQKILFRFFKLHGLSSAVFDKNDLKDCFRRLAKCFQEKSQLH